MEILENILKEKNKLPLIEEFIQNVLNNENYYSKQVKINEILSQLAYDLDYYQPDGDLRAEDCSYYGDNRLKKEILAALDKINTIE